MASKRLVGDFETTVCGIPCQIKVDTCRIIKGDSNCWDSDWDYYGYSEIEFTILDRKGYVADWLYRKAKKEGKLEAIEEEIIENA